MSTFNAQPRFDIEIYPYEGGGVQYTIDSSDGLLLEASVSKHIHTSQPGTFTLQLALGGPQGVNSVKTWTEICTPMSLVVIKASRYTHQEIVMIGLVSVAEETQTWNAARSAGRVITISGFDFQYYFTQFSYYTLTFLGSTAPAELSSALGPSALPSLQASATLGGLSPVQVAATWVNQFMGGKNGIMQNTKVNYQGSYKLWSDLLTQCYLPFPTEANFVIPMNEPFLSAQGTWFSKLSAILPMPLYEFFIITAKEGLYQTAPSVPSSNPISFGKYLFSPTLVARPLPIPILTYQNNEFGIDTSAWTALPEYKLDGYGFIESNIQFTEASVKNFYLIQPTTFLQIFGVANNLMPFVMSFQSLGDGASINRYGYRPEVYQTYWFPDAHGQATQQNYKNGASFELFVKNMLNRVASYYHPTPLMANGSMATILRPDIYPGNRFVYAPFKNGELWEFYITGVDHNFRFGEETTTTLTISRGLPQNVYNNKQLLTDIYTGNAMRQGGRYISGLPDGGTALQYITPKSAEAFEAGISKAFVTAQS